MTLSTGPQACGRIAKLSLSLSRKRAGQARGNQIKKERRIHGCTGYCSCVILIYSFPFPFLPLVSAFSPILLPSNAVPWDQAQLAAVLFGLWDACTNPAGI